MIERSELRLLMYEYTQFLYFEKNIAPRPLADVRVWL